jgi:hypothetical protein
MASDSVRDLQRRIRAYLTSAPYAGLPALDRYLCPRSPEPRRTRRRSGGQRYWIQLPQWLFAACRPAPNAVDREFLRDVLWAQYCLFLFVRIHDDLIDGQADDRRLIVVADELLLESQRVFARHFHDGRFASTVRDFVGATLAAILEVDAVQAIPRAFTAERLDLYARVSSIFKAGSAAVLAHVGRRRQFAHVALFCDHLAIAMQVLDDLFDIDQDLARGRFNFAGNIVLNGAPRSEAARLAKSVLVDDTVGRVIDVARDHVDRAAEAIAPIGVAAAARYVRRLQVEIRRYGDQVHRARVEHLLREVGDVSRTERTPFA